MTDRELLELAAKAAGIRLDKWADETEELSACFSAYLPVAGRESEYPEYWVHDVWNPLTDDGDALRLAVKLRLSMVLDSSGFKGPTTWVRGGAGLRTEKTQYHEGDPYAATRRAIVNTAAEIGKGREE